MAAEPRPNDWDVLTGTITSDVATLRRVALGILAEVGHVTEQAADLTAVPNLWRAAARLLRAVEDGRPKRIERAIMAYGDAAAEVLP